MTLSQVKKDIESLEKALKSPAMADNMRASFEKQLQILKDQEKDLTAQEKSKKEATRKPVAKKPAPKKEEPKKEEPAKVEKTADGKIKMTQIELYSPEGSMEVIKTFPQTHKTWGGASDALLPVLKDVMKYEEKHGDGGYNKVNFKVTWSDGETYKGRLDVSQKEDNPAKSGNVVGQHIYDYLYWMAYDPKSTESEASKKEYIDYLATYDLGTVVEKGKTPEKKEEPKKEEPTPSKKPAPTKTPKAKIVPLKPNAKGQLEYDCDELIEKEKEKKRKRQERANAPQKTQATKNRDKIEAVLENVSERLDSEELTLPEVEKLIGITQKLMTKLTSAKKKLSEKESDNDSPWVSGSHGNFKYEAKVFKEGSEFGINKGKVSKLTIWDSETEKMIVNYDRGWDIRPSAKYKKDYEAILAKLEKSKK
jgi:hypothetical protein